MFLKMPAQKNRNEDVRNHKNCKWWYTISRGNADLRCEIYVHLGWGECTPFRYMPTHNIPDVLDRIGAEALTQM